MKSSIDPEEVNAADQCGDECEHSPRRSGRSRVATAIEKVLTRAREIEPQKSLAEGRHDAGERPFRSPYRVLLLDHASNPSKQRQICVHIVIAVSSSQAPNTRKSAVSFNTQDRRLTNRASLDASCKNTTDGTKRKLDSRMYACFMCIETPQLGTKIRR